jgi:hypothetical protein
VTATSTEAATHARDVGRLSDRDIAAAVGASSGTVREWMDGDTTPSRAQADRLTELRGVVERIATGDHRAVARLISGPEDPGAA